MFKTNKRTPIKTMPIKTTPIKTTPTRTTPMLMARMLMVQSASSPPSLLTLTSVSLAKRPAATPRSRITVKLTMKSKWQDSSIMLLTVWRLKVTSIPTVMEHTSV